MTINFHSLGMRFGRHWLFRHLQDEIITGQSLAILGPNGSGKSTLLKILAGYVRPSEGTIKWTLNTQEVHEKDFMKHYALAAPYQELFDELSLLESLRFHNSLKPLKFTIEEAVSLGYFDGHEHKPIKQFSSGMKQRLRLILAFGSANDVLMLDEPLSNLDERGKMLYRELIQVYASQLCLLVASNDPEEYYFCDKQISLC